MTRRAKLGPLAPFAHFMGSTPVLPSLYWDVYSAEQRWKAIAKLLKRLCEYTKYMGEELNVDRDALNALLEDFEKFKESGFLDYYEQQLRDWIDANFADLIRYAIRQVYFGLTDDGYFCAYVPDSWADITFDTGMVFGRSDYGRLILRMDVDSPDAIDNTYEPSFSLAELETTLAGEFARLVGDVESVTNRVDTLYDEVFEP